MRTRSTSTPYGIAFGPTRVGRTYIASNDIATGLPPGTVIADYNPHYWPALDLGSKSETISDEMGAKDKFNQVEHEVCDFSRFPSEFGSQVTANNYWRQVSDCGRSSWYPHHVYGPTGPINARYVVCQYSKSIQDLVNDAAHAFYSENEANNLLNMIEFKQLRDGLVGSTLFLSKLLHILQSPFQTKATPLRGERFGFRTYLRSGWWHKSLKALAGEYLAFQFGYAPLVSDIGKTARGLSHLRRDLRRLVYSGNQRKVATAYVSGNYANAFDGIYGYAATAPSTPNSSFWHPRDSSQAPRLLVGVEGTSTKRLESAGFIAADYLLNKYVSSGPATLAWELVPFSFMLDWFLDLRPVLDALDQTLMSNPSVLKNVWVSEKRVIQYDVIKHLSAQDEGKDGSTYQDPYNGQAIGRCSSKYYRRYKTELRPKVQLSHKFGKKQGTLTGALFIQTCANLKSLLPR